MKAKCKYIKNKIFAADIELHTNSLAAGTGIVLRNTKISLRELAPPNRINAMKKNVLLFS